VRRILNLRLERVGADGADRAASLVFLVLAAVLGAAGPLLGLANGGYDIDAVGPAAVGVLIVVAGAVAIVPGAFPRTAPGLLAIGGLTGLAALTLISLAWSPNPDLGWLIAAKAILYVGAFALAVLVVRTGGAAVAALAGLGAGATVLALVTVVRVTTADDPLPQFFANRLSGSVGYHNGFAATLLAGAAALLAGAAARVRTPLGVVRRAVCGVGLGVVAITALASQSRGATLAALAAALVLLAISPARVRLIPPLAAAALAGVAAYGSVSDLNKAVSTGDPRLAAAAADPWVTRVLLAGLIIGAVGAVHGVLELRFRRSFEARRVARRVAAVVAALVVLAAIAGAAAKAGTIKEKLSDPIEAIAGSDVPKTGGRLLNISSSGRVEVWSETGPAFADSPLVGQGAGGFSIWWNENRDIGTTDTLLAHSVELETMSELGIAGLLLLVAWLAGIAWAAVNLWRYRALRRELTAALVAIPVFWLVAASFDWHWSLPSATLSAVVVAGALVGLASAYREGWVLPPTSAGLRAAIIAPVVAVALLGAAATGAPYVADRDVERAAAMGVRDPQGAFDALDRAEGINSRDPRIDELRARVFLSLGNFTRARQSLVEGTRRNPLLYTPWLRLADFDEFALDKPARAIPNLQRALRLHRFHGNGQLANRIKQARKKVFFQRRDRERARAAAQGR
jgi:tetratricopeptide (TPR) repeat protein